MKDSKDKFLHRMFLYRLQYLFGGVFAFGACYVMEDFLFFILNSKRVPEFLTYFLAFAFFNTVTYIYSKYLANKYGIEMFADLDQSWLREHQGFDSKAFGEIFARLIQCRKIAGVYMLAIIVPTAFINMNLAVGVGVIYLIAYLFYRNIYFDAAISYKIPRVFGGSLLISKIFENEKPNSDKK